MRWIVLAALLLGPLPSVADERPPVDVALVLAVDISLSMDRQDQEAQRNGYVEALRHPALHKVIARGRHGRIAVAYVEWGAPNDQRLTLDWTTIDGGETAAAVADYLEAQPYVSSRSTSISGVIDYAIGLFGEAPPADRWVMDISGDGPNNMGEPVLEARARALAAGIEINGLPLMLKPPDSVFAIADLDIYYEDCVIGGPAAFVIPVTHQSQFVGAIRQKLVLEIAQATPGPLLRETSGRIDCMVGENLYNRWRRGFR